MTIQAMSHRALAAAAMLAFAGCAVLRIDVDVYKGPLANHEDVQVQQLAVMATAAKPLLIRLRDSEQWPDLRNPEASVPGYRAGYMPMYENQWKNRLAKEVNAVLSLYEDAVRKGLEPYARSTAEALGDYRRQWRILTRQVDPGLWKRIEPAMKSTGGDDALDGLKSAYFNLFDPAYQKLRRADGIPDAYKKIVQKIENSSPPLASYEGVDAKRVRGAAIDPSLRSNAIYENLESAALVEVHAELLFQDKKSAEAKAFREAVLEMATAFRRAREDLRRLWKDSIDTLIAINASDYTTIVGSERHQVSRPLAKFIGTLSQPAYISYALCELRDETDNRGQPLREKLEAANPNFKLQPGDPSSKSVWGQPKGWEDAPGWREQGTEAIAAALSGNPEEVETVAKLLLFVDGELRSRSNAVWLPNNGCPKTLWEENPTQDRQKMTDGKVLEFGAVRGPSTSLTGEPSYTNLRASIQGIIGGAEGLERGRLPQGIETLIEKYLLLASQAPDQTDSEVIQASEVLSDSLVGFAEKVLFLANNQILLSGKEPYAAQRSSLDETSVLTYSRLLQAVGNSILVQADELRHRATHRQDQEDRAQAERRATMRPLALGAPATLKALVANIQAEARAADAKTPPDTTRRDALNKAAAVIGEHASEVIAAAFEQHADDSPAAVHLLLRQALQKAHKPSATFGPDKEYNDRLDVAIQELDKRPPPLDSAGLNVSLTPTLPNETARDVLDELIAALRHEYLLTVGSEGADGPRAKALADSIKAAYDQRSGMAYIRPSGAYLRSSYPTSTLQEDPSLGWENMLFNQAVRGLPLVGQTIANAGESDRIKIQSAIDQQFWQNINSVRLSGSGLTSYVLVKDDIGNWYIKAFSADTKMITDAATKLALFNLGPSLGTNLLANAPQSTGSDLDKVFNKYKQAYDDQTKRDFDSIFGSDQNTGLWKDLQDRITKAWDGDDNIKKAPQALHDFNQELTTQAGNLRDSLSGLKGSLAKDSTVTQGGLIVSALQQAKQLQRTLEAVLGSHRNKDDVNSSDTAKAAAAKATNDAVDAAINKSKIEIYTLLSRLVQTRLAAEKSYENAVVVLGDATK